MNTKTSIMTSMAFVVFLYLPQSSRGSESCKNLLQKMFQKVVRPVLREGGRLGKVQVSWDQDELVLESLEGDYRLGLGTPQSSGAPPLIERTQTGRWKSQVIVDPERLHSSSGQTLLQGQVRSAFRADSELHPHLRPKNQSPRKKNVLSIPQELSISQLLQFTPPQPSGKPTWIGLVKPPGMGKTTTAAHFIQAQGEKYRGMRGWIKTPKVLFVVENTLILDGAADTFQRELPLSQIARVYGSDADPIAPATDMIAITRTGYHSKLEEIHQFLTQDPDQPWVIVMDEAHHLGKDNGQFKLIVDDLNTHMDHRHLGLTLSATLWHTDSNLVVDLLEGRVHGPFLEPDEKAQLQRGENLPELSRIQTLRAIQMGYLTAIDALTIISTIHGRQASQHFDPSIPYSKAAGKDIVKRISDQRLENIYDRGALFFRTTEQANEYAHQISKSRTLHAESKPLHGNLSEREIRDTLDWIRDRGKYDTDEERSKHKYITVVSMLNEGTDIPELNLIVMAKTYANNQSGFKALLQNFGRGTRPGTEGVRLIDYSGYSRVLVDGVHDVVAGGGHHILPPQQRKFRSPIVIDDREVFIEDVIKLNYDLSSFTQKYPHFDSHIFSSKQGALLQLDKVSEKLGVSSFRKNHGARDLLLALANLLPDSIAKAGLLDELNQLVWTSSDGRGAKEGSMGAQNRIYESLYQIAKTHNLLVPEASVDLAHIHLKDGLAPLLTHYLGPLVPPLNTSQSTQFLSPMGSLLHLEKISDSLGVGSFGKKYGARDSIFALAKRLPESVSRNRLLTHLEMLKWSVNDGSNAKKGNRSAQARIYEGLYLIHNHVHSQKSQKALDRSPIHTQSGLQHLIDDLPSTAFSPLGATQSENFRSSHGALLYLASIASRLGVSNFNIHFGARESVLLLAERLPDSTQKTQLLTQLKKISWAATDGSIAKRGSRSAENRIYEALYRIAQTHNRLDPDNGIDVSQIHTKEGLVSLLKHYTEVQPPTLSDAQRTLFVSSKGALTGLSSVSSAYGVHSFGKASGARNLLTTLAQKLPVSKEKSQLLSTLAEIQWSISDGANAKKGYRSPQNRIHEALYRITQTHNLLHPKARVDVSQIHTQAGLESLLRHYPTHKIALLTDDQSRVFNSKEGALRYLAEISDSLGVNNFGRKFGARDTILALTQKLPVSKEKTQLLNALKAIKWSSSDGVGAKSDYRSPQNRIHEALYQMAQTLQKLYPDASLDISLMHTRTGLENLMSLLSKQMD